MRRGFVLVALLVGLVPGSALARAVPIVPDGYFKDWKKAGKPKVDPAGDAAAGRVDLGKIWVANDDDALYLRFQLSRETQLQETGSTGNRLRLLVDADRKGSTGLPAEGLGVDIEYRFGERQLILYDRDGNSVATSPGEGVVMGFPTHSASVFEVRVQLPAAANPNKRRRVRFVLLDDDPGGDRLPDAGAINYRFPKKQRVDPVAPIPLDRPSAEAVRVVSINTSQATLIRRPDLYADLLRALDPDVLALQEHVGWSPAQLVDYLDQNLPLAAGEWTVGQVEDTVVASRFPILAAAAVDANLVVHIDLPDALTPHDLVVFSAHPPCCANDAGRDREVDNMMATWRDLLAGGGPFPIDPMDAVILAGDFNFVGFRRQFDAIVNGTFIDPANGPDFAPGRDNGSLAVATGRHSHRRIAYTWRNPQSSFTPGRLDFIFFSDDVARLERSLVFDTASMPPALLATLGLETGDSLRISDHLPVVADLLFARP